MPSKFDSTEPTVILCKYPVNYHRVWQVTDDNMSITFVTKHDLTRSSDNPCHLYLVQLPMPKFPVAIALRHRLQCHQCNYFKQHKKPLKGKCFVVHLILYLSKVYTGWLAVFPCAFTMGTAQCAYTSMFLKKNWGYEPHMDQDDFDTFPVALKPKTLTESGWRWAKVQRRDMKSGSIC